MFGLITSALNTLLGFVFRTLVIKFVVFFALYFVVQELVKEMAQWLPHSTDLITLFTSLPDSVWYFLNLFLLPQGVGMVLSALLTRFIIRRIPVIG